MHGIYRSRIGDGQSELVIGGPTDYQLAAFSPDGKWILAFAGKRGTAKKKLTRTLSLGGNQEDIADVDSALELHCTYGAPGVCIMSEVIGKEAVFSRIDPALGRVGEVSRVNASNLHWALSPDGGRIAMVENMSNTVRILNVRSKEVQVIHPQPQTEGLQFVAWSADAKRYYVSSIDAKLFSMDPDGKTHLLLSSDGWLGWPVPSPDGKRLAYAEMIYQSNITLLENF